MRFFDKTIVFAPAKPRYNAVAMIKKIICAISCFLFAFSPAIGYLTAGDGSTGKDVNASGGYARILNEKTPFYSDPDLRTVKFYLPYSYFVRITNEGVDSTRVAYMENRDAPVREGYIKTCDLFVFERVPENPYPDLKLVLKNDEVLFSNPADKTARVVLSVGDSAIYYGELPVGNETFYYVYSGIYVGYVRKAAFFDHTLSLHPEPLPKPEIPVSSSETDEHEHAFSSPKSYIFSGEAITIAIVLAISFIGISVIYILFRPDSHAAKKAASGDDE